MCSLLSGLNLTPSKKLADIYFLKPFPLTSFDELRQTDPGGGAHNIFGAVQNTRRFIKQEHVKKRARTGIVEEFPLNVDCIQLKMAEDRFDGVHFFERHLLLEVENPLLRVFGFRQLADLFYDVVCRMDSNAVSTIQYYCCSVSV